MSQSRCMNDKTKPKTISKIPKTKYKLISYFELFDRLDLPSDLGLTGVVRGFFFIFSNSKMSVKSPDLKFVPWSEWVSLGKETHWWVGQKPYGVPCPGVELFLPSIVPNIRERKITHFRQKEINWHKGIAVQ